MSDFIASEHNDSGAAPPEQPTFWTRAAFALRVLQVRLRFILVLIAIFAVLALWNYLAEFTDWTITRLTGTGSRPESISPDTEYFCPMCPGAVSNWPEKCPVCKMPLVRRRKGDAALLPEGVLARMQLSPQRLQLAGVETTAAQYRALDRTWRSTGTVHVDPQRLHIVTAPASGEMIRVSNEFVWQQVKQDQRLAVISEPAPSGSTGQVTAPRPELVVTAEHDGYVVRLNASTGQLIGAGDTVAEIADLSVVHVLTRVAQEDLPLIELGQEVEVQADDESRTATRGHIIAIEPILDHPAAGAGVRIETEGDVARIHPGMLVNVTWRIPLARIEPFRSHPRNPPPLSADDVRTVYRCPDHPAYLHTSEGECPFDKKELERRDLAANQRLEWSCPAHPDVSAKAAGTCEHCATLPLAAQVVSYSPAEQVLAIPDSAIIDMGTSHIVFVEHGPGMFDAVPIEVGPRAGNMRSVVSGLEADQRVVSSGAFLLDAETRLTSNLSAAYFGAGKRSTSSPSTVVESATNSSLSLVDLQNLPPGDAARVRLQKVCPATGFALGSMGTPVRIRAGEHVIYLCCGGCKSKVQGAEDFPIDVPDPTSSHEPRPVGEVASRP